LPRKLEGPLVEGDLTLRLPRVEDRHKFGQYAADATSLEGAWLPLGEPDADPEAWAAWFVRELVLGWSPLGGRWGGTLVIDYGAESLVGVVCLQRRKPTVAEIVYGVAPAWRCRGIATTATRLATEWALSGGGFARIEARIDQSHSGSLRVVERAGFRLAETFQTHVEGTGNTCDDVLYVRP